MSDLSEAEQGTPAQSMFFEKLHSMVNNESYTGAVDWLPDGQGFVILLKQTFSDDILPSYFGQAKYASFTRRLKRWGFMRGSNSGAYIHDKFRRGMVFDLDFDEEHPTVMNNIPSKTLPLKKRTKWVSPSPSSFEERRLAQHGSPSVQNSDVKVMPELIRTINRQKRKEKREEHHEAAASQDKKPVAHQDRIMKRSSTLVQSVEAAKTLASLYYPASKRRARENVHFSPPVRSAYESLERRVMNPQNNEVRQTKRCDNCQKNDNAAENTSLDEVHNSLVGLNLCVDASKFCHLATNSTTVPIRNIKQRGNPAFNRAA